MADYNIALSNATKLLSSNDINAAKNAFKQLAENFPDKIDPYYCLGMLEAREKNIKSAIYYTQKAIEVAPFAEAYEALAEYYILLQDIQNSLKYIKLALIYNPFNERMKNYLYKLSPNSDFIDTKDYPIDGSYEHSKDCPFLNYLKAYDSEIITRTSPNFIETQFTNYQKNLIDKTLEEYKSCIASEGFVLEIPDAIVISKQSEQTYFISQDGKFLEDIRDVGPNLNVDNLPENIIHPCDNLLVLSTHYSGNYYHWLTWTVPRLKMILDAGYKFEDFDKILINYLGFKFQKELIKMLNIPEEKIIGTLPKGAIFKVNIAVTASLPEFLKTPKIVTKSLRELLLKPEYLKKETPKRIYLSRNKSKTRFVVNENELQEFIKKYGFTTIYAEDLTVEEQIGYFNNADVILSQHGAGLTNLAFCKPQTTAIEIYNEKLRERLDTSFWKISANENLNHFFMFGEPIGEGQNANMRVDIKKLEEIFEAAKL